MSVFLLASLSSTLHLCDSAILRDIKASLRSYLDLTSPEPYTTTRCPIGSALPEGMGPMEQREFDCKWCKRGSCTLWFACLGTAAPRRAGWYCELWQRSAGGRLSISPSQRLPCIWFLPAATQSLGSLGKPANSIYCHGWRIHGLRSARRCK